MQLAKLLLWVFVWQAPMWLGAQIAMTNMAWYHSLVRPAFSPPDWVFGPVWAVLYIMLALSGYFLTKKGMDATNQKAVWLMIAQLVLNAAWTPLFFGMHHLAGSMILVLVMIGMTIWLMRAARPVSRAATWMLVPYLAWLVFAWVLNTSIWMMN
ncbi:MAG: tryptophan-rich sensory protein [Elusimicrobiaceae bacterium]|nr:tryptophan-rich sensory protein [Elusimicrobiaceae bacterium]